MISDIIDTIISLELSLILLDKAKYHVEKELYIQKILFLCHTGQ